MPHETNAIARSGLPLFFELENSRDVGIASPETRMVNSLRTWVLYLSAFQKRRWSRLPAQAGSGGRLPTKSLVSKAMTLRLARWRS